jgi:hypothetical protein
MVAFSHNGVVSNDICIQVETATTAAVHVSAIAAWVARVVSQRFPVHTCSYPHMVVAGTLHSDCKDDSGKLQNTVLVAVHQSEEQNMPGSVFHNSTYEGLVVTSEAKRSPPVLCAKEFTDALEGDANQPSDITALGVSGVSEAYQREVWSEIISTERNWMDGSGKGYMVHPMFMCDERSGVFDIREMSFNFGWENYNETMSEND